MENNEMSPVLRERKVKRTRPRSTKAKCKVCPVIIDKLKVTRNKLRVLGQNVQDIFSEIQNLIGDERVERCDASTSRACEPKMEVDEDVSEVIEDVISQDQARDRAFKIEDEEMESAGVVDVKTESENVKAKDNGLKIEDEEMESAGVVDVKPESENVKNLVWFDGSNFSFSSGIEPLVDTDNEEDLFLKIENVFSQDSATEEDESQLFKKEEACASLNDEIIDSDLSLPSEISSGMSISDFERFRVSISDEEEEQLNVEEIENVNENNNLQIENVFEEDNQPQVEIENVNGNNNLQIENVFEEDNQPQVEIENVNGNNNLQVVNVLAMILNPHQDANAEDYVPEENIPLGVIVRRQRNECDAAKFTKIASRCTSERNIWAYRLRSSDPPNQDRPDWPLFVVISLINKFNAEFMKCAKLGENEQINNQAGRFELSRNINIQCNASNKKYPKAVIKIHFPLIIVEHDHEIYLLGVNRLESVKIQVRDEVQRQLATSDELSQDRCGLSSAQDTQNVTTNVLVIKNIDKFNHVVSQGSVMIGYMLRFLISKPMIFVKVVGWAEMSISMSSRTGVFEDYLILVRDLDEQNCIFAVSENEFAELKEAIGHFNQMLKISGFQFSHWLPKQVLPHMQNMTSRSSPQHQLININSEEVLFLTKSEKWCWGY